MSVDFSQQTGVLSALYREIFLEIGIFVVLEFLRDTSVWYF